MKRARSLELGLGSGAQWRRPLWRSLERTIAWEIDVGRLPAGRRLPSTRTLAARLRLSRNTVALAFDALVADGYLAARVGDGTYVLPLVARTSRPLWERWSVCSSAGGPLGEWPPWGRARRRQVGPQQSNRPKSRDFSGG